MADDQRSLTRLLPIQQASATALKAIFQKIEDRYGSQMRRDIERRLDPRLRARLDADDIWQDVMATLLEERPALKSGDEVKAWCWKVATDAVSNAGRDQFRQCRDVSREENAAEQVADAHARQTRQGRQERLKRKYSKEIEPPTAARIEIDPFMDTGTITLATYGMSAEQAVALRDFVKRLEEFDKREGNCLRDVLRCKIRGLTEKQIAAQLDVSRETVRRKTRLIEKEWREAKSVSLLLPDGDTRDRTIIMRWTRAADLLADQGLHGRRLVARGTDGEIVREFGANDRVYDHIADRETLAVIE